MNTDVVHEHKGAVAIEARGAIPFYLPAYSPDNAPARRLVPSAAWPISVGIGGRIAAKASRLAWTMHPGDSAGVLIETISARPICAGPSAHRCLGSPRVNSLRADVT